MMTSKAALVGVMPVSNSCKTNANQCFFPIRHSFSAPCQASATHCIEHALHSSKTFPAGIAQML
jgi:hypothetical protein